MLGILGPGRGPGRGVNGWSGRGRGPDPAAEPPGGGGHLKRTKFVLNAVKDAFG